MSQVEKFEKFKSEFNDFLLERIPKTNNVLHKAIRYSLENGGKRFRAYLLFIVGRHFKYSKHQLYSLGSAIEMIHAYSLVHDDLPCMDDDDLRRGLPTLHKKYNDSTAVLIGDALQTLSFQLIAEDKSFSDEIKIMVISKLAKTTGQNGMIHGQFMDLYFEGNLATKDEIIEMNILKTSLLIEAAMGIPLIIKGDKNQNWTDLQRIVGLSFQIIDDIIDITQPTEILGKTAKKDLVAQKKTLPLLLGIDATKEELNKNKKDALNIISNLKLSDHPLKFYIENLFSRVR